LAEKQHPYASPGAIAAAINQFRKSFPAKVTADTLRKLAIAPQNESYVINTLRFIGAIDPEGNKTEKSTAVFNQHDPAAFQKSFGEMVETAYAELFELHKEGSWELSFDSLISFFRNADQTSDVVGRRQASTFQALASLAGHGEPPTQTKPNTTKTKVAQPKNGKAKTPKSETPAVTINPGGQQQRGDFALTVRIEVNLPPAGDQETYDRIFRSIRENLLNAK
jgi:Family of unknown function (DUF5343)